MPSKNWIEVNPQGLYEVAFAMTFPIASLSALARIFIGISLALLLWPTVTLAGPLSARLETVP